MKKVIICAHRGLEDSAPENTHAAFEGALEQGMAIEFDIQRTADDHLVVVHDPTVDRTTDGSGEIASMSFAQIKALDAGSWYGPQFTGQRVLTFDEVLELVKSYRLVSPAVALDVKLLPPGTIALIRDCLERHGLIEDVICIGAGLTSDDIRREFREASSRFQSAVLAQTPEDIDAALNDVHSTWVYARFVPTDEDVLQVNRGGKRMIVSGVKVALDVNGAHEACKAGADMVMTWHPSKLKELVGA
jgi:glycerophosphoryl diester phosphodiesterase